MVKGNVAFILHAHLPYVHHPEQEGFLEERWLFEAISETYIPLLNTFLALSQEGVDFKLNMSLSPTLLSMLTNKLLQSRYIKYLENLISLSEKEIERTWAQPEFNSLARMYHRKYIKDLKDFTHVYGCNLVNAYRGFQESGHIEIMCSAATHGFLPLMSNSCAVRAQVSLGVDIYLKYFGRRPLGIWLPECGYTPSIENVLRENGLEYFITESHGILYSDPKPVFGTNCPVVTPNGLVAFGRDADSSKQVWSATEGYPGDFDYREFYRDIGYDLDYEHIRPYLPPDGQRIHTGIKYYRVTGKTDCKQPYNPLTAKYKADCHAENFLCSRQKQIIELSQKMDRPPIIVCPYDAELFGHWWYEGPFWLYCLFKKIDCSQSDFKLTTLSEYMERNPLMQVCSPCPSTWGHKGYSEVWLNESNDWIYKHLDKSAQMMSRLANENPSCEGLKKDAMNQAARELLLAQSSDWAFIMRTGTVVPYAVKRTQEHINRFTRLYNDINADNIDPSWLSSIQAQDDIFPELDYRIYL